MKIAYRALLFLFVVLQSACQTGSALENDLKNEVIKVHDRIMPRSAEIIEAKKALFQVISTLDSLKQSQPEIDTGLVHTQADSLIHALDSADDAMSEWMYGFKTEYPKMEHEEIMLYLNDEKNKITEIERTYNASIEGAQDLLNRIGKK